MIKFIMVLVILIATVYAEAHTIDISFITINNKPTVEIVKDDIVYHIPISKEDLNTLSPDEIVKKVCQDTSLCLLK